MNRQLNVVIKGTELSIGNNVAILEQRDLKGKKTGYYSVVYHQRTVRVNGGLYATYEAADNYYERVVSWMHNQISQQVKV